MSGRVGDIIIRITDTPPPHTLELNGAIISRSTYSKLFAAIGIRHGAGDGSTTFALPDLRGEFIRGWDHGRGVDIGRTLCSIQSDEIMTHSHVIANFSPQGLPATVGSEYYWRNGGVSSYRTSNAGGAETRPRNVAAMFCIVYE
ncbi:MAG: phage tail protein [Cloacibacillus sp.]